MGRAQKCLIGAQTDQNGPPIDPNGEFWESSLESVTRGGCAANTNNPIKMGHFRHNSHTDCLFCWIVSRLLIKRASEQRNKQHTQRGRD